MEQFDDMTERADKAEREVEELRSRAYDEELKGQILQAQGRLPTSPFLNKFTVT